METRTFLIALALDSSHCLLIVLVFHNPSVINVISRRQGSLPSASTDTHI